MENLTTIELDSILFQKAELYAQHRNMTVSELVTYYLTTLPVLPLDEKPDDYCEFLESLHPDIRALIGVIKPINGHYIDNHKVIVSDYLAEKYL